MSFRTDLRDGAAAAELGKLQAFGVQVSYTHEGATAITLWALPKRSDELEAAELGRMQTFEQQREWVIPRQTSSEGTAFPPANGPKPRDIITHQSVDYYAETVKSDSLEAVYTFVCRRRQAHDVR